MCSRIVPRVSDFAAFVLAVAVIIASPTQAQSPDEIRELKALLQQTQQSMQDMMKQHQTQIEALQQRIEELETRTEAAEESAEAIEETLMERQVEDVESKSLLDSNVSLHGYYDFLFLDANNSKSRSFVLNELSLFLRGTTDDEKWTFFSELEFEVINPDDFYFFTNQSDSEFEIETAWLEYSISDALQFRAGKHLLPQYWQTYHYPNLTLSTRPPAMVGRIFPDNIVGIEARGSYWFENQRGVSYVAYLGNGNNSDTGDVDQNEDKAVGGRLTAHFGTDDSLFETIDFSVSGYTGMNDYDRHEDIVGVDAQIRSGKWELLTEWAWGDQDVELRGNGGARRLVSTDTMGYYAQLGYQFLPRWHAFYRYDELDLYEYGSTPLDAHQNTVGVNFRPLPNISLKLELFQAELDRNNESLEGIATAVVYNF